MLDIGTLRVVQAGVAIVAFFLIFFGTYRPTRTNYAGTWSLVVLGASLSSLIYVSAEVTGEYRIAAALGNGMAAMSSAFVWGAVRGLRGKKTPWWYYIAPGVLTASGSYLEAPEGAAWPSGWVLMVAMASLLTMAAWQLRAILRGRFAEKSMLASSDAKTALWALALGATVVAAFYAVRLAVFLTMGPEANLYQFAIGPTMTNLAIIFMMVIVTYSVVELSRFELTHAWRLMATHDDLTGLLSRSAFAEKAEGVLKAWSTEGVVVMADFDHFKRINDTYGHAVGDRILKTFAEACRQVLAPEDVAGRWGGEEFILVLPRATEASARAVTADIARHVAAATRADDAPATLSFGIAALEAEVSFEALVARADAAMYEAKRQGRNRTVVYTPALPMGASRQTETEH